MRRKRLSKALEQLNFPRILIETPKIHFLVGLTLPSTSSLTYTVYCMYSTHSSFHLYSSPLLHVVKSSTRWWERINFHKTAAKLVVQQDDTSEIHAINRYAYWQWIFTLTLFEQIVSLKDFLNLYRYLKTMGFNSWPAGCR